MRDVLPMVGREVDSDNKHKADKQGPDDDILLLKD